MDKVILITGTRKGIGKFLSEHFLEKDYKVYGCSRGQGTIEHQNYTHFSLDITDEKAVIKMVRDVNKMERRIDILINNAGIASMNHTLLTPLSTSKKLTNTNFHGTFVISREVSKIMVKHKTGRIVNFTTVASPLNLEGEAIYASSKAAVEKLTQIMAKELGEFGITVNAIGPTPIYTDLIRTVPKNKIDELIEQQAVKRMGNYDDVVNVIDFFIDDKSNFITGQLIYLGGIN